VEDFVGDDLYYDEWAAELQAQYESEEN